jgi:hypothetical protein
VLVPQTCELAKNVVAKCHCQSVRRSQRFPMYANLCSLVTKIPPEREISIPDQLFDLSPLSGARCLRTARGADSDRRKR